MAGSAHLQREEQKATILDLRRGGATLRQIARQVGLSKSRVGQILQRALADLVAENSADAKALRALEDQRLDAALLAVWTCATATTPKPSLTQLHCIDRLLRISAARCRLHGLDAPVKVARTDGTGADAPPAGWVMVLPEPAEDLDAWAAAAPPPPSTPSE